MGTRSGRRAPFLGSPTSFAFSLSLAKQKKTARPNPALASLRDARTAWPFRRHLGGRQSDVAEEMIIQIAQRSALPAPDEPGAERGSAPPQHRAERCGP